MRLKTLRKEPPVFEVEGAVIRGSRVNLSNNEIKSPRHRTTAPVILPEPSDTPLTVPLTAALIEQADDMSARRSQPIHIQDAVSQVTDLSAYQAIEAVYLGQGIRIRLSPTKVNAPAAPAIQPTGRRSANSLQRHTTFTNRNPSRTSSVLHYATTTQDLDHDGRSFSALQQMSSVGFDHSHPHNVSFAQTSQASEMAASQDYYSVSMNTSEHSNPTALAEKTVRRRDSSTATTALNSNDHDLAYMSSLLKTSAGQSYRDTIRRRAGLRETFAVHRHPETASYNQLSHREKSPTTHRTSMMRSATMVVASPPSPQKIDKDILKHASRLRSSQSKDYSTKSPPFEGTSTNSSYLKAQAAKRIPTQKSFKSISLEPLELLLGPRVPRSSSLLLPNLPSAQPTSSSHLPKTSPKRTKSAKVPSLKTDSTNKSTLIEQLHASSTMQSDSLSLIKASALNCVRQSSSFDSGFHDRSSSGGDVQSFTSSSIIQVPSSIPSVRLNSSTTRRSNNTKKVSFYEEPTAIILTTATYV